MHEWVRGKGTEGRCGVCRGCQRDACGACSLCKRGLFEECIDKFCSEEETGRLKRAHMKELYLKNMKKAATLKAYTRGTRMLKKHGIPCHANFIIGFPGDRPENTPKFIDFVDDEGIEFYYATPWFCSPATPIADDATSSAASGPRPRARRWSSLRARNTAPVRPVTGRPRARACSGSRR